VSPAERRQRVLDDAFQAGWDDGANDPSLTERQIERIAFLIAPHVATRPRIEAAALPQAA
jgi:hypothetical protein